MWPTKSQIFTTNIWPFAERACWALFWITFLCEHSKSFFKPGSRQSHGNRNVMWGAGWLSLVLLGEKRTGDTRRSCCCCCCLITKLCPTLCSPMDCSPPGSFVHGILQARILEWVAIPSSRDLPGPGIEPTSPALQADSLSLSYWGSLLYMYIYI